MDDTIEAFYEVCDAVIQVKPSVTLSVTLTVESIAVERFFDRAEVLVSWTLRSVCCDSFNWSIITSFISLFAFAADNSLSASAFSAYTSPNFLTILMWWTFAASNFTSKDSELAGARVHRCTHTNQHKEQRPPGNFPGRSRWRTTTSIHPSRKRGLAWLTSYCFSLAGVAEGTVERKPNQAKPTNKTNRLQNPSTANSSILRNT